MKSHIENKVVKRIRKFKVQPLKKLEINESKLIIKINLFYRQFFFNDFDFSSF